MSLPTIDVTRAPVEEGCVITKTFGGETFAFSFASLDEAQDAAAHEYNQILFQLNALRAGG